MTEPPRETGVLDAVVSLVDSLLGDFDVVDLQARKLMTDPQSRPALLAAITQFASAPPP